MTANLTISRFVKSVTDAIRICLLALACLTGCLFGDEEEPDQVELARMREYLRSVPEDRMLELFRSGIDDRHGRSEIFYQELINRDSRALIKNEILGLLRERESPPNPSRLMLPGQQMPAHLAAKYFGHEPDFKAALLQLVLDTNVWAQMHDPDYGKTLLKRSSTIDLVLGALAKNEYPGALPTVLAIGQGGQLVPGSRLTFYLSLARRYNAFESEREEILRALAGHLQKEPDGELLSKLNGNSNFNIVQDALRKHGLIPAKFPAENKVARGDISALRPDEQGESVRNGMEKPENVRILEKSGNGNLRRTPKFGPGVKLGLWWSGAGLEPNLNHTK